jgi:hypothetical protein
MGNALQAIVNGLTYEGNVMHSRINYSLIVITVMPFPVSSRHLPKVRVRRWIICLLIALAAQIILWFVADAIGVSVIWCTMAGYLLMERIHLSRTLELFRHHLFTTALICALGAILYYALTFPMITTLAHGIAVLMGIGISYLLRV